MSVERPTTSKADVALQLKLFMRIFCGDHMQAEGGRPRERGKGRERDVVTCYHALIKDPERDDGIIFRRRPSAANGTPLLTL